MIPKPETRHARIAGAGLSVGLDRLSHGAKIGGFRSYLPIPLEMEWCACPMCGRNDHVTLLVFDSFGFPIHTVECRNCGLLYSNPRPTERYLEDFYQHRYLYFYEGVSKISEAHLRARQLRELAERRFDRYRRFLSPGLRVLDIGCGTGLFLNEIRKQLPSAEVIGVEPDNVASEYSERILNLPVHHGFLDTFATSAPFDVVTAFHVIEHIYDLDAFFETVRCLLRPGGLFLAETPNAGGSWADIGMFHIAHLQTFSLHTLSNLCRAKGFDLVEGEPLENDNEKSNLYLVARTCGPVPLSLGPRDSLESARIAAKCYGIRSSRYGRISRTWLKWIYFKLGGKKR